MTEVLYKFPLPTKTSFILWAVNWFSIALLRSDSLIEADAGFPTTNANYKWLCILIRSSSVKVKIVASAKGGYWSNEQNPQLVNLFWTHR